VAILKWNTPPSGNQEDRRAHVVGHGEGIALVHTLGGERVQGGAMVNAINENFDVATKWSTAPYKGETRQVKPLPPSPYGYRDASRVNKCMANEDTCNAFAVDKYERRYCNAHGRSIAKKEALEDALFSEDE